MPSALVSYQLPAASISPGESFRAIFYFENRAPIDANLNVLVRIVGRGWAGISAQRRLALGAATSSWAQGVVWPDGHDLMIPAGTPPGYYRVEVGFYDPATGELLNAVQTSSGEPIGDIVALDFIRVGEPPSRPAQPLQPPAELGGVVRLTGTNWRDASGASVRARPPGAAPRRSVSI